MQICGLFEGRERERARARARARERERERDIYRESDIYGGTGQGQARPGQARARANKAAVEPSGEDPERALQENKD